MNTIERLQDLYDETGFLDPAMEEAWPKLLDLYKATKSFEDQEPGSSWAKVSRALMALDADE